MALPPIPDHVVSHTHPFPPLISDSEPYIPTSPPLPSTFHKAFREILVENIIIKTQCHSPIQAPDCSLNRFRILTCCCDLCAPLQSPLQKLLSLLGKDLPHPYHSDPGRSHTAAALPGASRCFAEPVSALLSHHTLRGPPELPSGQIPHKHSLFNRI